MRNQSEKLIDLFISQFGEKHGYIIYQRIPFTNPWASKEPSYIVSAAERAQFISEFQGKAPLILQRMVRDIFIAMISFVASSQVLQIVLGDLATAAELTLLALHLGTIAVVENRRLNTIWDAPLRVMGTRAPAPFAADENRGWTTPLTRLDKRELGLVAAGCVQCRPRHDRAARGGCLAAGSLWGHRAVPGLGHRRCPVRSRRRGAAMGMVQALN